MVSDLQKASLWKRISAFLFDFILLGIVAVLFALALSAVTGYDGYSRTVTESGRFPSSLLLSFQDLVTGMSTNSASGSGVGAGT